MLFRPMTTFLIMDEQRWTFLPPVVDLQQFGISVIRTGIHFWI
jgi:hypothetical protein